MANFTIPAPVETEKSTFLHDRTQRPAAPPASRMELVQRWGILAAGIALSVGASALLFSIRDSWNNHREWLVSVIPLLVIAAIGLAYLVARREIVPLATGLVFLFLALLFGGADLIADNDSGASDTTRDVLSILGGISLGAAVLALVFAFFWVEIRKPTKAPTPEM